MFVRKSADAAPVGEPQNETEIPSGWSRRQQEDSGQWNNLFLDIDAKLVLPEVSPPIPSAEHTRAEDDSREKTYWISYYYGIVKSYDDALQRIDAISRAVDTDRRMSAKAKTLCLEAAGRVRKSIAERRNGYTTKLAELVKDGKVHLAKVVSPHHQALEATIREHSEDEAT